MISLSISTDGDSTFTNTLSGNTVCSAFARVGVSITQLESTTPDSASSVPGPLPVLGAGPNA
jgi:hypothetical protein